MAGGPRCPGMVRRAAAPLEFMVAWLPKCSVTFAGLGGRLVGNPARSVRTKEHAVSLREELLMRREKSGTALFASRARMIVRTDGEDSILIDFCSFTRGREAISPPYRKAYRKWSVPPPGTRIESTQNVLGLTGTQLCTSRVPSRSQLYSSSKQDQSIALRSAASPSLLTQTKSDRMMSNRVMEA